jgi:hypothetical protein
MKLMSNLMLLTQEDNSREGNDQYNLSWPPASCIGHQSSLNFPGMLHLNPLFIYININYKYVDSFLKVIWSESQFDQKNYEKHFKTEILFPASRNTPLSKKVLQKVWR